MDLKSLNNFLTGSNNSGYATGKSSDWIKEKNGSTTIVNASGPWKLVDNFFGGEPYGGHVIVYHNQKPYWMMVYYGYVTDKELDHKDVYAFLKKALASPSGDSPYRGPKSFIEDGWEYKNSWEGSLERYNGEEIILFKDQEVYKAWYSGGLVDQRK